MSDAEKTTDKATAAAAAEKSSAEADLTKYKVCRRNPCFNASTDPVNISEIRQHRISYTES
jgi:hypothetical protein